MERPRTVAVDGDDDHGGRASPLVKSVSHQVNDVLRDMARDYDDDDDQPPPQPPPSQPVQQQPPPAAVQQQTQQAPQQPKPAPAAAPIYATSPKPEPIMGPTPVAVTPQPQPQPEPTPPQPQSQYQQQPQMPTATAPAAAAAAAKIVPKEAPPFPAVLDRAHLTAPWYFASMDRKQAEARLSKSPERSFVVRPSSQAGCLSLSHTEAGGAVGHGIIHCWDTPDRRGFSIEQAPETYLTVEHLLLSLPLRHKDFAIDPNNTTAPVLVFKPGQPRPAQPAAAPAAPTPQQSEEARLAAKLAEKLDAAPPAALKSQVSVALTQLRHDSDMPPTPARTNTDAIVSALSVLDDLSDDDDGDAAAPPAKSAPQPAEDVFSMLNELVEEEDRATASAPPPVGQRPRGNTVQNALAVLDTLSDDDEAEPARTAPDQVAQALSVLDTLSDDDDDGGDDIADVRGEPDRVAEALNVLDDLSDDDDDGDAEPTRAAPVDVNAALSVLDNLSDDEAPQEPVDQVRNALDVLDQLSDDDEEEGDYGDYAAAPNVQDALNVLDDLSDDDDEDNGAAAAADQEALLLAEDEAALEAAQAMARVAAEREYSALMAQAGADDSYAAVEAARRRAAGAHEDDEDEDSEAALRRIEEAENPPYVASEYDDLVKNEVVGEEYSDLVVVPEAARSALTQSSIARDRVVQIEQQRKAAAGELERAKEAAAARRRADEEEEMARAELARQMAEDEAAEEVEAEVARSGNAVSRLQIQDALDVLDDLSDSDDNAAADASTADPMAQFAHLLAAVDRATVSAALARADRRCLAVGDEDEGAAQAAAALIADADALLAAHSLPAEAHARLQRALARLVAARDAVAAADDDVVTSADVVLNLSLSSVPPPPVIPKAPPLPMSAPPGGAAPSDAELVATVRRLTLLLDAHAEAERLESAAKRDEWLRAAGAAGTPSAGAGSAAGGVQIAQIAGAAARLRGGPNVGIGSVVSAAAAAKELKARAVQKSNGAPAAAAPAVPKAPPPAAAKPWAADRDALTRALERLSGTKAAQRGDEAAVEAIGNAEAALAAVAALEQASSKAGEGGAASAAAALSPTRGELRRLFAQFGDNRGLSRAAANAALRALGEADESDAFAEHAEPIAFATFEIVVRRRAAERALAAIARGGGSVSANELRACLPATLHELVAARLGDGDDALPLDAAARQLLQPVTT